MSNHAYSITVDIRVVRVSVDRRIAIQRNLPDSNLHRPSPTTMARAQAGAYTRSEPQDYLRNFGFPVSAAELGGMFGFRD